MSKYDKMALRNSREENSRLIRESHELLIRAAKAERERDEARERADRAERFCARASTAAGEHGFVCADAVSLRGELASARALIARAAEAVEPFAKMSFSFDGYSFEMADIVFEGRVIATVKTSYDHATLQATVDSLAALAADLRKAIGRMNCDTWIVVGAQAEMQCQWSSKLPWVECTIIDIEDRDVQVEHSGGIKTWTVKKFLRPATGVGITDLSQAGEGI